MCQKTKIKCEVSSTHVQMKKIMLLHVYIVHSIRTLSVLIKIPLPSSICRYTLIPSLQGKLTFSSILVSLALKESHFIPSFIYATSKLVEDVMSGEQAMMGSQSSVLPYIVQLYRRASIQWKQCKKQTCKIIWFNMYMK